MRHLVAMLIFLSLILPGAAKAATDEFSRFGPFAPYVKTFDINARMYGYMVATQRISIRFTVVLDDNVIGQCWPDREGPTILINRSIWLRMSPIQQEQVILHEMGHCLLAKAHDRRLKKDGMPVSIMYPSSAPFWDHPGYYSNHRDEYIAEFFAGIFTQY